MARDGSGNYSLPEAAFTSGTTISSSAMNSNLSDLASALTGSVARDGQAAFTADQSMGNNKITSLASATARAHAANAGQLQDLKLGWVTAGGSADAITASYSPAYAALADGMCCFVRFGAANATTTPTFAPSGLTARTITKWGGDALAVGDIDENHEGVLRYNLANTRWELLNPKVGTLYSDPLTTRGDIVRRGAAATERLALGSNGAIVSSDGTDVKYQTLAALLEILSATNGRSLLRQAGAWSAWVPPFTVGFVSAAQTITSGGALTLAHALGATPKLVQITLKCIDAGGEAGYAQNDVTFYPTLNTAGAVGGVSVVPDGTNLNVRFSSSASVFEIVNKSDGAQASLTNTKWNAIFSAWA
jgi:hypothetical protein